MSVCSNCFEAGLVDYCSGSIVIGGVPTSSTLNVFIQHNATGLLQSITESSNSSGYVTIPLGLDSVILDPVQGYTLWVTLGEANSTPQPIISGETIFDCISIQTIKSLNPPELTWINP
jgi:hypothetical protein